MSPAHPRQAPGNFPWTRRSAAALAALVGASATAQEGPGYPRRASMKRTGHLGFMMISPCNIIIKTELEL